MILRQINPFPIIINMDIYIRIWLAILIILAGIHTKHLLHVLFLG